jgi:uncharacterized damage-inducible protein DinB
MAERRADMFVDPDEDPRTDPSMVADERATLVGFLRWYRDTLELKCSGLDPEQLARRSVEPSTMSLLGLVRHMAEVERSWFRIIMAGLDAPAHFVTREHLDRDFEGAVGETSAVEEAWRIWRDEVAFAERFVEEARSLDVTGRTADDEVSLRWVLVHMIEEYARHIGHADLMRERIDFTLPTALAPAGED